MTSHLHPITQKINPPIYEITCFPFGIVLYQDGPNAFTVRYGKQTLGNLTYEKAAAELGESIMHVLAYCGMVRRKY